MRARRGAWLLVAAVVAAGLLASPPGAGGPLKASDGPVPFTGVAELELSSHTLKLELEGTATIAQFERAIPVPIEIVELNLKSVSPITVPGIPAGTRWDVFAPTGRVTPRPCGGGTFDSQLPVCPSLTFTRLGFRKYPLGQTVEGTFGGGEIVLQGSGGGFLNVPAEEVSLGALDHFKCYSVKARQGFAPQSVKLADQFQAVEAKLVKPLTLCAPVSKNREKVRLPAAHLKCYATAGPSPKQVEVGVRDQFGRQKLVVLQARTLCVPTLKKRVQTVPAKLVPPAGSLERLTDSFTCYDVKPKEPFAARVVGLVDQFEVGRAKVLRPVSLCTPAYKNGGKLRDSVRHLTCYAIQDLSRKVKPGGRLAVVHNQFGTEVLEVGGPQTLCLPSQKTPPCTAYTSTGKADMLVGGQKVGELVSLTLIPYKGVKGGPCE